MSFSFHGVAPPPPMAPTKTTIKLALEGPNAEKEGPFVKIPVDGPIGNQTLETLRKKSLDLWQATNGSFDENLDDAKVLLTYRDAEGDLCFIFSEGDLRCAIPMFPASLKMFAKIEFPKKNTAEDTKSTQTQTNASAGSSTNSFRDIPVHKVVETLTGVLAAANVALQNHATSARAYSTEQRTKDAPQDTNPSDAMRQTVQISNTQEKKPAQAETQTEEEPPEARIFIHGRHTCDGCLTTPVVGKRFHATNLPDYDLCATCMGNYKGDEVKFEEAVDERDRPHQERWYRRYNKWTMKNQRQAQKQARKEERCARRWQNCQQNRPRGWNQHPRCFGPPPDKCGPPPDQVDMALKEAIRRSMLDLKQSKKENTEEKKEQPAKPDSPDVENSPVVNLAEPDMKPAPVKIEAKAPPQEDEFLIPTVAPVGAPPARPAEEIKQPEVTVIPNVVEAKEAPVVDEEDSKPPASVKSEEATTSEKTEDSFADDAEGNGEVAEALGETMDAIANAINEISAELETELSKAVSDADSKKSEEQASKGATILSGEEEIEEKSDDEASQTSWDVVASDETLARAAQIIGSALFESEVNGRANSNAEESVSMLDSNDSIPTTLPSVTSETPGVAPAQLNRWAPQLHQLHELGFNDDRASVEIMERLEAANIGSGEDADISVERVVNELMAAW